MLHVSPRFRVSQSTSISVPTRLSPKAVKVRMSSHFPFQLTSINHHTPTPSAYHGSHPQPHTVRYLGIKLTATLSWQADITDCLATATNKFNAIVAASYSYLQKLMLLSDNVVMAAAYKLEAGGFTPSSAAKIDKQIARWAKEIIGAGSTMALNLEPACTPLTDAHYRLPT